MYSFTALSTSNSPGTSPILISNATFSNVKAFLANAIKEYCPDLNPLNIPTHPEDFLWYAERVNGRIAMLTITSVLMVEFATKESIFQLIGLFN
jgi:hypothetical protein